MFSIRPKLHIILMQFKLCWKFILHISAFLFTLMFFSKHFIFKIVQSCLEKGCHYCVTPPPHTQYLLGRWQKILSHNIVLKKLGGQHGSQNTVFGPKNTIFSALQIIACISLFLASWHMPITDNPSLSWFQYIYDIK